MVNTLLRYPGGKSRAVKILKKYIPEDTKELCSPFFGGGSFEIYCNRELNIKIYGYDLFEPLTNFWECVKKDKEKLSEEIQKYHPITKETFLEIREKISDTKLNEYVRAAYFFVINRSSFSGSTLSGGFSKQSGEKRFTVSSIKRVKNFDSTDIHVSHAHFRDSIKKHDNILLYCDPPYYLKSKSNLYGNKGNLHNNFEHNELCEILKKRDKWILSYNNCEEIKELYKDYRIIPTSWTYGMSKDKISKNKEIIILSNDIKIDLN